LPLTILSNGCRYGTRPKVDLLWRLKVPGSWDKWSRGSGYWERNSLRTVKDIPEEGGVPSIGWVARLNSGVKELEKMGNINHRGLIRMVAIERLLLQLDAKVMREIYNFNPKEKYV
jgi:hypothetical protein